MDYLLLAVLFLGAIVWGAWANRRSQRRTALERDASGVSDAKGLPRP